MAKDKIKLREEDKVLYYDGFTLMDLTKVVKVDKVNNEVTLANGVKCQRESKTNNFKRTDYLSKGFEGFIHKLTEEDQELYDCWMFKGRFIRECETLQSRMAMTKPELNELAFNGVGLEYLKKIKKHWEIIMKTTKQ